MNYRHVYMLIIEHAKSEMKNGLRPKSSYYRKNFPEQYFEFHHILPRSIFPNWIKRKSNIVALTAREHFFCHQLLTKIFPCREMFNALIAMCSKGKLSKNQLDKCKKAAVLRNKTFQVGCKWWTDGVIDRFSKICPDGFYAGRTNGNYKPSYSNKRTHWYNNGITSVMATEPPDDTFMVGRLQKDADKCRKNCRLNNNNFKEMSDDEKSNRINKGLQTRIDNYNKLSIEEKTYLKEKRKESVRQTIKHRDKDKIEQIHNTFSNIAKSRNAGRKWWTNGTYNKFTYECPGLGWYLGITKHN